MFNLAVLFGFLIIWQLISLTEILPQSLFPSPFNVTQSILDSPRDWIGAAQDTSLAAMSGLLIAVLAGSMLAFLLSLSAFLKKIILPLAVFFQTVPIIAIAPLLVIYFGFGLSTVVAASAIVSFFPVLASFLIGLESAEKEKLELFQIYQAGRWQTLVKLRLPTAFLSLYSGLKIAVGLSLIGAVAGEFVAGGGLGSIIDSARTQQRVDRVFAALILLSLIGLLALKALQLVFKSIHQIRPFGAHSQEFK